MTNMVLDHTPKMWLVQSFATPREMLFYSTWQCFWCWHEGNPGQEPFWQGWPATSRVRPCYMRRRAPQCKLFLINPCAVRTEQSQLLVSSLGHGCILWLLSDYWIQDGKPRHQVCERNRLLATHWAATAHSLCNITETHSLIGRRPQRRWQKETGREGDKRSWEKKMRKGWDQVKENRDILRREQKQGDYLNAL